MNWEEIDNAIEELDQLVGNADWMPFEGSLQRIREKCDEIQEGFNSKPRYPTKPQRDFAWDRFNALRSKGFNIRREQRTALSKKMRDQLLRELGLADHNLGDIIAENTILFFAKTDVEDMKQKGQALRDIRQRLRDNHSVLLHEHHQELWTRILAVQSNHDAWWGQWKARKGQRDEERQAKAKRHEEWEAHVNVNLANNRAKLAKAEAALENCESHAEQLRAQIESAWNEKFKERAEGWLAQDEERIKSIEENIGRIKEWISEDERKLQG